MLAYHKGRSQQLNTQVQPKYTLMLTVTRAVQHILQNTTATSNWDTLHLYLVLVYDQFLHFNLFYQFVSVTHVTLGSQARTNTVIFTKHCEKGLMMTIW
jgi:hypothetical protein